MKSADIQPSLLMTPTRRIVATVLRPPLLVSHTELNFSIPHSFLDTSQESLPHEKVYMCTCIFPFLLITYTFFLISQVIVFTNVSEEPLTWGLDCSKSLRIIDGTFQFVSPSGAELIATDKYFYSGVLHPGEEFSFMVLCYPGT